MGTGGVDRGGRVSWIGGSSGGLAICCLLVLHLKGVHSQTASHLSPMIRWSHCIRRSTSPNLQLRDIKVTHNNNNGENIWFDI